MSNLPGVDETIEDGGLGTGLPSTGKSVAVVGCSSAGTAQTPTGFVNKGKLVAGFGYGPGIEASCLDIAKGALVIFCKTPNTTPGTAGAVTHTGTGRAVLTLTSSVPYDTYEGIAKVTRAGAAGVDPEPAFQISLDNGNTYSGDIRVPANGIYTVPNTGVVLNWGIAAAKVYTFDNTTDTFTSVAHGFVVGDALTLTSTLLTPTGYVALSTVYVIAAGLTADAFKVSPTLGGASVDYSSNGTGVQTATRSATMVVDDTYTFATVEPKWAGADVDTAMDALSNSIKEFRFVHLVGPSDVTRCTAVATKMDAMETADRYVSALCEVRDFNGGESEATWMAAQSLAFVNFASSRVVVGAGHCRLQSAVSSRVHRRPFAWAAAQRAVAIEIHVDLGRVKDGSLTAVSDIYHDERVSEGLDADRFLTARTFHDEPGFFVTNPKVMSAPGSDFKYWQHRFVMDAACRTTHRILQREVNDSVRLNDGREDPTAAGHILEEDAQAIEAANDDQLRNDLIAPGHASAARTSVARDDDIAGTSTVNAEIEVIPLGYKKFIKAKLRFVKSLAA